MPETPLQTALALAPRLAETRLGPIEYVEDGEGPVVLALHGAMGGYDQSLLLARTIGGPGYRYLAVSRPGYLGTPLSSGATPEAQADLLAALLAALGLEQACVMAVSGGGPAALYFALRHPGRCRALVLASTIGTAMTNPIPLSFTVMTRLMRWPALAGYLSRQAANNGDRAAARAIPDPAVRARTLADPEAGLLLRAMFASTAHRMAERLDGTEVDIREARRLAVPLEAIEAPALVVHGTADRVAPYDPHAVALSTRLPGAELLAVEGGEHVAIFTDRATVQPRVAAFLNQHAR